MRYYAGIGSRSLSHAQKNFCFAVGAWLATQGWALRTGAAQGADQAFANGALSVGGTVALFLPWDSYERDWVDSCLLAGAYVSVLKNSDYIHNASVDKYHPAPEKLSGAVRKLHARNSMIVTDSVFVLAYPGAQLGGTGQGIRIADSKGIEVIRLDLPHQRLRVENKIGVKL